MKSTLGRSLACLSSANYFCGAKKTNISEQQFNWVTLVRGYARGKREGGKRDGEMEENRERPELFKPVCHKTER